MFSQGAQRLGEGLGLVCAVVDGVSQSLIQMQLMKAD